MLKNIKNIKNIKNRFILFNKINKFVVVGLFITASSIFADTQYWHNTKVALKANDYIKFAIDDEIRTSKNASILNYNHFDLGMDVRIVKVSGFTFLGGLGYRQVFAKDSKEVWRTENMPHAHLTFVYTLPLNITIKDRNRFEYRYFYHQDNTVRYRNRVTLDYTYKYAEDTAFIKPYIFAEMYLNLIDNLPYKEKGNSVAVDEVRFYAGIDFGFLKNYAVGPYYALLNKYTKQTNGTWGWQQDHVFGIATEFSF